MREWWESLNERERLILGAGGVILLIMLFWLMVWDPLVQKQARLDQDIESYRELRQDMMQAAAQAQQLRASQGQSPRRSSNRSLLALVDSRSKAAGLDKYVKRIQPEGSQEVRLWIEGASFQSLSQWLFELQENEGILLEGGSLDRADAEGRVKARLNLGRGSR